jgi:transposase InsO family protein
LHFDQGFQYQHAMWCNRFESRRITKSMSRKGNCLDNSKVETSFAT